MRILYHLLSTNDCPLWYLILLVFLVPILYSITKKSLISILVPYVLLIIGETLIFRSVSIAPRAEFELFWSYKDLSKYWFEILANIVVFIPLGFMFYKMWGWKGILVALIFSIGIEVIQLVAHLGLFEFDDIFNNSIGTIIGSVPLIIYKRFKSKNNERKT